MISHLYPSMVGIFWMGRLGKLVCINVCVRTHLCEATTVPVNQLPPCSCEIGGDMLNEPVPELTGEMSSMYWGPSKNSG